MKKFKEYNPKQPILLSTCINDWLPEDHPVHFLSEVVEQLELSAVCNEYRESQGQPAH